MERSELALIAAVILNAIRDLSHPSYRDSATRWLMDRSPRPFGFAWCAETLGMNADWARNKIIDRKFNINPLLQVQR